MSRPISRAKQSLLQCIQDVSKNAWLFSAAPGKDFTRNRKLSFETMIKTLLCMEGGNLTNELMKQFGCRADVVSASAFVQQRGKILPAAFETIFRLFAEDSDTGRLFNGYRLFAVDGSDLQIPTNPQEKDSFFPGSDGQHPYNLLHLNAMYDLLQRTYTSAFDYLPTRNKKHIPAVFYQLPFRVVRFPIAESSFETVVTNLPLDFFPPPSELKKLYALRWGIETSFRELKYTIGLLHFHAKKTEHILQEIFARLTMYNFSELITSHVVIQKKNRKYACKANFSVAVHVCRQFFLGNVSPPNVEALIARHVSPIRPGRSRPRILSAKNAISFIYRVA